jgi:hypothetical protein
MQAPKESQGLGIEEATTYTYSTGSNEFVVLTHSEIEFLIRLVKKMNMIHIFKMNFWKKIHFLT